MATRSTARIRSTNSGSEDGIETLAVVGSTTPRLYTPPLVTGPPGPCGCGCALTPETSVGFDQADFADRVLGKPLDPWQRWLAIHGGELLADGRPRFRVLVVLVARQNGKTYFLVVLSLYWQFVDAVPLILGTSTKLDYARESWHKGVKLAESAPLLQRLRPRPRWKREANGEQESWTSEGSRYKIAASNEEGGRSLTIDRLVLDELRQHHDYTAWEASEPATSAVPDAQIWAISNAGDARSVVLRDLRDDALAFIATGEGDPRLGLMEWSAPPKSAPDDPAAIAAANPSVGRGRVQLDDLVAKARRAMRRGGRSLAGYKTEYLCQWVGHSDPAIDPLAWAARLEVGTLDDVRDRVALCLDVAPDQQHATLYAAAVLDDDRARIDHVADWSGPGCVDQLLRELPGLVGGFRVRPRAIGWLPNGPAAAAGARLLKRRNPAPGQPARATKIGRVDVVEIRAEAPAVCMGFAGEVTAGTVVHSGDPLMDDQVAGAEWRTRGDVKVFARSDDGHVDAVYAAAGAVHLARTLPRRRQISRRARSAPAA